MQILKTILLGAAVTALGFAVLLVLLAITATFGYVVISHFALL